METYYTKKEYNDMKRSLENKIKILEKQLRLSSNQLNKFKNKNVAD